MPSTKEKVLMNQIRLSASQKNWVAIRYNVGKIKVDDNTFLDFGPPEGHPDIIIFTDKTQTIFVEAKIRPNVPTKEQKKFLQEMKRRGFIAEVIYSIEEFENLVQSILKGEKYERNS
jgi:hypothetical protein